MTRCSSMTALFVTFNATWDFSEIIASISYFYVLYFVNILHLIKVSK